MLYREGGQFKTSYGGDQAIFPIAQDRWIMTALVLAAFLVIPCFATQYVYTEVLIPVLILSIAAIGLNILTGYCGQVSLGTGGFMAVAAYVLYNFWLRVPLFNDLIIVVLFGGVMAAIFGVLFGLPSLRIKGFYLAVATLAAQFCRLGRGAHQVADQLCAVRLGQCGQSQGAWIPINTPETRYLFILAVTVVLALVAKNLVRGRIGRQWTAIRDMDIAAEITGRAARQREAVGVRRLLLFYRNFGILVRFPAARRLGTAGVLNRPLFSGALHDHHWRARLDSGLVPGCDLHRADANLSQSVADLARHPSIDGDNRAYRGDGLRVDDCARPAAGAQWPCPLVADHQGEAQTMAVALLI